MKSDILSFHLTNTIHRINDSIKNESYTADKFRMLSKFGPESWALWAVVSPFLTPLWLIAVMLNYRSLRGTYYYHLNIKEIDHIVFTTKMVHVMFHETASRKLLVFTLYVNPYMSNWVSHFNLLDELITWSDATVVMLGLHCLPTSHKMEASLKWVQHHTLGAWDNKSKFSKM